MKTMSALFHSIHFILDLNPFAVLVSAHENLMDLKISCLSFCMGVNNFMCISINVCGEWEIII